MTMKQLVLTTMLVLLLAACKGVKGSTTAVDENRDSTITDARLLAMDRQPGYTRVTVKDPWNEGKALHTYVLVPRDTELPKDLPEGTVVRTPLQNALVYSAVHTSVMRELGAIDALGGVVDVQYFTDEAVVRDVEAGRLADCGSSMNPTIEKVIEMNPDAILLSPYQDAKYGQIESLNIPLIECADYMEFSPLGRAEWIKFYGELLGKREQADSIYAEVKKQYLALKEQAASVSHKPKVITEMVISGIWDLPAGESYMAQMLKDAGGDYPWADTKGSGSLKLDFNQVLDKAQDADIWLIKSFNIHTLADVKGAYSLNDSFKAFKENNVYACDTYKSHFFEEFPFHPELLLREYTYLFHPELVGDYKLRYYEKMR